MKAWGSTNGAARHRLENCNDELTPVEVKELGGVTAIAAGGFHSLALLINSTVEAWGADDKGQLGNGTFSANPSDTPVAVQGLIGVHAIAAGETHSLAAMNGGEVEAWGSNKSGELGNGTRDSPSNIPDAGERPHRSDLRGARSQSVSVALQSTGTSGRGALNGEGQLGSAAKK